MNSLRAVRATMDVIGLGLPLWVGLFAYVAARVLRALLFGKTKPKRS